MLGVEGIDCLSGRGKVALAGVLVGEGDALHTGRGRGGNTPDVVFDGYRRGGGLAELVQSKHVCRGIRLWTRDGVTVDDEVKGLGVDVRAQRLQQRGDVAG